MDISPGSPVWVIYPDRDYYVENIDDWKAMPDIGLQFIVYEENSNWWCCDEYLYEGQAPKLGLYLTEEAFEEVRKRAFAKHN